MIKIKLLKLFCFASMFFVLSFANALSDGNAEVPCTAHGNDYKALDEIFSTVDYAATNVESESGEQEAAAVD